VRAREMKRFFTTTTSIRVGVENASTALAEVDHSPSQTPLLFTF